MRPPLSLRRYLTYLAFGFRAVVLKDKRPYLLILMINDQCNLNCFYCEGKNTGLLELDYPQAVRLLKEGYCRGHRVLVLTGGEPFLWNREGRTLADLIKEARHLGFLDITIFTNGTHPLQIHGCTYIVTIDGTREIHNQIRQGTYDLILKNVEKACGRVVASITLSKANALHLEEMVREITSTGKFRAITFNLLTHWPEMVVRHGLLGDERKEVLDRLWRLKKQGYPLIFSRAAYNGLRENNWKRPIPQIELATRDQVFTCCRDILHPDVCEICGYSSCVEISQALNGRLTAIWELAKVALN